jgi:DNA-binding MarR family transcriptional regulator
MLPAHANSPAVDGETGRFIDDYLLYLLARASHAISGEFHQELRRRGVSVAVWRVLASLVGTPGGGTVTGLAETCLLQQPTMTKLLDRMTREGLVERRPDAKDRRVVRIGLTPAGASKAAALVAAARQHEAAVLARHAEVEPAAAKALLRSVMQRHLKSRRGVAAN